MFFKNQGLIQYDFFGDNQAVTDITKISLLINKNLSILQSINVDSRTPEQIAYDIYEDTSLFWTILYVNEIVDPFTEWHMSDYQLDLYCERIYGKDDVYKIRYFRDIRTNDIYVGNDMIKYQEMLDNDIQLPEHIEFITNIEYERLKNHNRVVIKVIPKSHINKFVEDYKRALKV